MFGALAHSSARINNSGDPLPLAQGRDRRKLSSKFGRSSGEQDGMPLVMLVLVSSDSAAEAFNTKPFASWSRSCRKCAWR